MKTSKEKAKELYDEFPQYLWDEQDGWMPDHDSTVILCENICNYIQREFEVDCEYWRNVSKELKNLSI